jgi:stage II sporulation protein D
VLLLRSSKPLSVYSLGEVEIRSENAQGAAGRPRVVRGRVTVRREAGEFAIVQGGRVLATSSARRLRLVSLNPYNLLEVGGLVYRGHLEVIAGADGSLSAVNVVGVEDYLRGVLPYELGTVDRDALEALKAQAVAARTYVYRRMLAAPSGDFHVHADVQDQVYKGVKSEYLLSDRAVRETRGLALAFGDSLAQCYYHSTCGGRTASRHEVWNGDSVGYLISRPDLAPDGTRFCQASRYSEWRQEWTLPQLAGILKRNLASAQVPAFPPFAAVTGLEVPVRAACGRVKALRIHTDKGPILVKGDRVRWALRPAGAEEKILPSAWFDVKVAGGRAVAEGRAFGHGIGLCQFGSIARARAGQDFRRIMQAYYAGTELVEYR